MVFLTACQAASPSPPPEIESRADLIQALEKAGRRVRETEQGGFVLSGAQGRVLFVDDAALYVYEFPHADDREAVTDRLSPDGRELSRTPLPWDARPRIWGTGPLMVVYPGSEGSLILLLDGLLGNPLTSAGPGFDAPYPPAVTAAIEWLAEAHRVSPQSVEVIAFEPRQWPDSCLGLPSGDERCRQIEIPGWSVELELDGTRFRVRTDELGQVMREGG